MSDEQRRLRDPIHGLIVFDEKNETDQLAWKLIQKPEFQRLRRIRQLGISEFVFPGATHTRFSHSIGVYHCARRLMKIIERKEGCFNTDRAQVALIAALLHDLGHGPFSHAFEAARKAIAEDREQPGVKHHEHFTAEIIQSEEGEIRKFLGDDLAKQIADLVRAESPADIYHAVVSSSFDADRMDYLMRDRYMTGTGAGAIDLDWLLDNLTTYQIPLSQDGDESETEVVTTFAFKSKGRQAAEDFLLARYRLYTQVYHHKNTRGFEQLLTAFLRLMEKYVDELSNFGLNERHPLVRFLRPDGETINNYKNLDDTVVWSAIECLRDCKNDMIAAIAKRLWLRHPLKILDISSEVGHDDIRHRNALNFLKDKYRDELGKIVFLDEPECGLYPATEKLHKAVRVVTGGCSAKQVHQFPDTIINEKLTKKTKISRFYFLSDDEREKARKVMGGN